MAHPRKLIRQAVVALLAAANTAAGSRVRPTRVEPHKKGELPAIAVYTLNDPVDEDATSGAEEMHELELEVVGWVAHTDTLSADDAMDDLAEQIEAAMNAEMAGTTAFLSGKASNVRLVGTTMQVVEDNGRVDPTVGVIVLTYAVAYRTDLTAPSAALDDFLSVDAKHRIVGVVEGNQAEDIFVVQEPPP